MSGVEVVVGLVVREVVRRDSWKDFDMESGLRVV
jgi:hypothetical protein